MDTVFYHSRVNEQAFFSADQLVSPIEGFPEICVSTFSDEIISVFAKAETTVKIAELHSANGTIPVYKLTYNGCEIAFYKSMVGAPACVCQCEEVLAMGVKKLVFFGSCGVLDNERVGQRLIVPSAAIRDEGTSYHYVAPSEEISLDPYWLNVLKEVFDELKIDYVEGKTWTTDGAYRETIEAVQSHRAAGCLCVEMECSALAAMTQVRKVPFVQFLYGADSLSSDTWEMRDLGLHGLNQADLYMFVALECELAMSKVNKIR